MGSKIINFKDLKVEHPNRYKVTDSNGSEDIKKIDFDPGLIYQQGTPESAENFNNIQKNCIYEVNGVRILEGQEEIYDISIDGFDNFEFESLKILMTPNATNTIKGSFVRLNGAKYIIKNRTDSIGIGQIFGSEKILLTLNSSLKVANVVGVLGGGSIRTLKEVDDLKVDKAGGVMSGTLIANGGITINTDQNIFFNRNSDWFKMGFKSASDQDIDSYGYIDMGDNGNEYFKFRNISGETTTDLLTIKSDHARWKGYPLYHQGFKPSKSDVGLGDISNFPATSAVNDPSDAKYATAAAVKIANDNANTRLSSSGGAMKGSITIDSTVLRAMYFNKTGAEIHANNNVTGFVKDGSWLLGVRNEGSIYTKGNLEVGGEKITVKGAVVLHAENFNPAERNCTPRTSRVEADLTSATPVKDLVGSGSWYVGNGGWDGVDARTQIYVLNGENRGHGGIQFSNYHGSQSAYYGNFKVRCISNQNVKEDWLSIMTRKGNYGGLNNLNTTNGSSLAWNKDHKGKFIMDAGNNRMVMWLDETTNARKANIQVGHADSNNYANTLGTLALQPLGGALTINGKTALHTGNSGVAHGFGGRSRTTYTFGSQILGVSAIHTGGSIQGLRAAVSGNTFTIYDGYSESIALTIVVNYLP